jgi:hypothetical protein
MPEEQEQPQESESGSFYCELNNLDNSAKESSAVRKIQFTPKMILFLIGGLLALILMIGSSFGGKKVREPENQKARIKNQVSSIEKVDDADIVSLGTEEKYEDEEDEEVGLKPSDVVDETPITQSETESPQSTIRNQQSAIYYGGGYYRQEEREERDNSSSIVAFTNREQRTDDRKQKIENRSQIVAYRPNNLPTQSSNHLSIYPSGSIFVAETDFDISTDYDNHFTATILVPEMLKGNKILMKISGDRTKKNRVSAEPVKLIVDNDEYPVKGDILGLLQGGYVNKHILQQVFAPTLGVGIATLGTVAGSLMTNPLSKGGTTIVVGNGGVSAGNDMTRAGTSIVANKISSLDAKTTIRLPAGTVFELLLTEKVEVKGDYSIPIPVKKRQRNNNQYIPVLYTNNDIEYLYQLAEK